MNANDAVERLRDYAALKIGTLAPSEARAILAHITSQAERIDALTAELAAAKGERDRALARGGYDTRPLTAANVVGFTDCKMIGASGAHLTSEGEV